MKTTFRIPLTVFLLLVCAYAGAQTVTGKVTSISEGSGMPGVSVLLKGTTIGTTTDADGNYTLSNSGLPTGTLVFSFVGYGTEEVEVANRTQIDVQMTEDIFSLGEVVVTAFGVKRSEKTVTYATQQVSSDELTRVKTDNMVNTLNGKIAGVTITPSASGVGGSSKVILRGNRSFVGNNQPLYVIDGVPVTNAGNSNGQPNSPFGGSTNVDGGDAISTLNPDDIESISVLKGASASALYGSQAANGVILITTKKGKEGQTQINFNSSIIASKAAYTPDFQNSYGRTTETASDSWGAAAAGTGDKNTDEFFRTGINWTNSISLSGGNEIAQTYFSYANTKATGIMPGNEMKRNNFMFRESAKFFDKKLTVDGSINYTSQEIDNSPAMGLYFNPLTGLYLFPRNEDIMPYKNQYEYALEKGYDRQNWYNNEDIRQNPWWVVNRNLNESIRKRYLMTGSAKWEFNKNLSLALRGNIDHLEDSYEQDLFSGTVAALVRSGSGQFILNTQTTEQKYGDALLTFTVPMESAFKVDGLVGTSITDSYVTGTSLGAGNGLKVPNLFIAQNTVPSGQVSNASTMKLNHTQLQSVFGNVNVGYNEWLFLNATARNDWSSNLAFTSNGSFFYPAVGLSGVLTDALDLPSVLTYAKVRVNYAEVGNTVPIYAPNPRNYLDPNTAAIVISNVLPFATLKPERTKTYEIGTDLKFFDNRLSVMFNYYKSNTFNQFVRLTPSAATLHEVGYINAGEIENKGFEFQVGYDVVSNDKIKWNTALNGSRNVNTIIDVASDRNINSFVLTPSNNTNYQSEMHVGGSYGDIYGYKANRDAQGRIIVNNDGSPSKNNAFQYIGNPTPKFAAGWTNTVSYGKFTLNVLVDGKFGGHVLSLTQAYLDQYGVSEVTEDARAQGGVKVNGVDADGQAVEGADPEAWYKAAGGRNGISEFYMYDATVVRLREASLGYTLPISNNVIKSMRVSLTGRNLMYFYKKAPYDPELTMSTGNGLSGVDIFNQPATRNIGFMVNVTL
ncbi:SusC/RagA family TonB-linked outer membrane protein [Dawidia soli]|uniref:SusC/RagA family TonB-linked outer membrane protein n=1 Tax=Dawidia soli TaxID=2782352 RepID=A0AAP2D5R5_9BACT|nr:SusC/RagA family TonB-linked outer membrane protein [Dawidia soli]MBT1685888.1 SusC/RagA family TonB-linked outer membrane protein [Dawidia soli]